MITTNTGAKKLESSDNWREIFPNPGTSAAGAHNASVDAADRIQPEIAPIINGKQCALGAASGDYVLLRNSTIAGKSDGAYQATKAIPANTDLDSTYLGSAITGGMVNELNNNLTMLSGIMAYARLHSTSGGSIGTHIKNYIADGNKCGVFLALGSATDRPGTAPNYRIRYTCTEGSNAVDVEAWEYDNNSSYFISAANAITGVLETWKQFALKNFEVSTTGFNGNLGTGYCRWVRYGSLVIADITCMETTLAIDTTSVIAFAPNGFMPKVNNRSQFASWDISGNKSLTIANANSEFIIDTNGYVKQAITRAMPAGSALHIHFVYEAT